MERGMARLGLESALCLAKAVPEDHYEVGEGV